MGIQDLDEAILFDPQLSQAYVSRGFAYFLLSQYERAIQDYDEATLLDPQDAYHYELRAQAYSFLGRDKEAGQAFDKAVALGDDRSTLEDKIQEIKKLR